MVGVGGPGGYWYCGAVGRLYGYELAAVTAAQALAALALARLCCAGRPALAPLRPAAKLAATAGAAFGAYWQGCAVDPGAVAACARPPVRPCTSPLRSHPDLGAGPPPADSGVRARVRAPAEQEAAVTPRPCCPATLSAWVLNQARCHRDGCRPLGALEAVRSDPVRAWNRDLRPAAHSRPGLGHHRRPPITVAAATAVRPAAAGALAVTCTNFPS